MTLDGQRSVPEVVRFVDLCAGLGGFHHGLSLARRALSQAAGHVVYEFECVLASEIDEELRRLYVRNFPEIEPTYRRLFPPAATADLVEPLREAEEQFAAGLELYDEAGRLARVHGDLRSLVDEVRGELRRRPGGDPIIPEHDLLCAGFPCQPFSKSGSQRGFEDTRGTLFHLLALVIQHRSPDLVLLENVGNFERHDGGNTWRRVRAVLEDLGYDVAATEHLATSKGAPGLLSPHHVGLPHHRERFFIIAQKRGSDRFPPILGRNPFPPGSRRYRSSVEHRDKMEQAAARRLASIISAIPVDSPRDIELARLSEHRLAAVGHWGELLKRLKESDEGQGKPVWRGSMPSFPIWGYELDPWQWYPIDESPARYRKNPELLPTRRSAELEAAALEVHTRSAGCIDLLAYPPQGPRAFLAECDLSSTAAAAWVETWPGYASQRASWPRWKRRFIEQNRQWALELWSRLDPSWLRGWLDDLFGRFPAASHQKLEWNCKQADLDIYRHIVQFRPSGIRVQRLRHIPALVAMTTTQVPVVPVTTDLSKADGPRAPMRHVLPSEALQLQGFPPNWNRPSARERTFQALGNAVHAELVAEIIKFWLHTSDGGSAGHDEQPPASEQQVELLLRTA